MAGLNKEFWTPKIVEGFVPDGSFIKESTDYTPFVTNDILNIPVAGARPSVTVNKDMSGVDAKLTTVKRTDTAVAIPLDNLSTDRVIIRDIEQMELSYDKLKSVIKGSKDALNETAIKLSAHGFAPGKNSNITPVFGTSGIVRTTGFKSMTFADVIKMAEDFDRQNLPSDGRILLLSSEHSSDLMVEDMKLYNQLMDTNTLYGFKIYKTTATPLYDKATGVKLAIGSASDKKTNSSVFWHKDEVMRAIGSVKMFADVDDAAMQATAVSFLQRFKASQITGRGIGAIYSADATA